jgi:flagellin-specific chaperone FliS
MYLIHSLTDADLKRDIAVFDQSIGMLEELAKAWRAIATSAEAVQPESAKQVRMSSSSSPVTRPVFANAWS